jgi:hypothetical protein
VLQASEVSRQASDQDVEKDTAVRQHVGCVVPDARLSPDRHAMRGDVDVACWQRSNRTMSWGDPMAVANGRLIAILPPVIIAIIACRQVVVLVLDRPHRMSIYRYRDS